MRIAYLVNQYPKVSHSFVRREILALEALGHTVSRFTIRGTTEALVDEGDRSEQELTRRILSVGGHGLAAALARAAARRPVQFARASALAYEMGKLSERGLSYHAAYLAEACVLSEWLEEVRAQHLHAHFGTNSTTVALLAHELGGPPFSFTSHGPEEYDKPHLLSLGLKVERSAFAVAISDFGRSQLYRWCNLDHWHKVQVVRCGLDRAFLDAPATPVLAETRRLVNVGRLNEQKGQLLLLDAASDLLRLGLEFELIFVGDGELRAAIEERISALGLTQRTTITGWASSEQVREELLKARALVLPSFAEGLPIVLMEAMALARPVATTYIAGIPELVDRESGWLITPGSRESLVTTLSQVLSTGPDELMRMGLHGRDRVRQLHDAEKNAAVLAALFENPPAKTS